MKYGEPDIQVLYNIYKQHPVISTDSRAIKKNSIFFALKGDNFNGNTFVSEAFSLGAAYAIVDDADYVINKNCLLVKNSLKALQKLASEHRKHLHIPVIGITGSNGKTSTKELLYVVLKQKYNTLATVGNLNNHIGVPLTILNITNETEIAIIEMGANHPGEIKMLCDIAQPNYGIITNIGKAHLDGFGSFQNIIDTKKALYHTLKNNKGIAFVNFNDPLLISLSQMNNCIYYGKNRLLFCRGKIINNEFLLKIHWDSNSPDKIPEEAKTIQTQLIGNYNFNNILAAICTGLFFKINPIQIKQAIENYTPSMLRSQFKETAYNKIILDAYNANPVSTKAALINFISLKLNNKIVILGDMFELGNAAIKEHKNIIQLVKKQNFSHNFFIGEVYYNLLMNKEENKINNITPFKDTASAMQFFKDNSLKNASILIKGSRGMKLELLVNLF